MAHQHIGLHREGEVDGAKCSSAFGEAACPQRASHVQTKVGGRHPGGTVSQPVAPIGHLHCRLQL